MTQPLRLLIVDDNRDAADSLGMVLRLHKHDVQVCYNGATALATARALPPDAMLIDLAMPAMDGVRLAELVREEKALSDTILVAVTGYGGPTYEEAARVAGFDHYLLKPFEIGDLLTMLRSAKKQLRAGTEERRDVVDEIAEMARRQSEKAHWAAQHLRDNPPPGPQARR